MNELAHGFLTRKHVVVFGAGYVGGAVARCVCAAGGMVTALTRNPIRAAALKQAGIRTVVADLAAATWWNAMPVRPDFVLNAVSSGGGGVEGYRASYVDGLRSMLAWAQTTQGAAGRLVYTSSTSVYAQSGGQRVDELLPAEPVDERGKILREAEELAVRWSGGSVVLRLAGIYGPERHHLLDRLRTGELTIPGSGQHRLNLIHRDDIVDAVMHAWSHPTPPAPIYNVADDGAVTKAELVHWLAEQLCLDRPEFAGGTVPGRRPNPPDRVIANDRIKQDLGWRPHYPTFREGYAAILGA